MIDATTAEVTGLVSVCVSGSRTLRAVIGLWGSKIKGNSRFWSRMEIPDKEVGDNVWENKIKIG